MRFSKYLGICLTNSNYLTPLVYMHAWGGDHLQHPQGMCIPLAWVEIGEHLQYLSPSGGDGGGAPFFLYVIHSASSSTLGGDGGGAHLHHP